MIWLPSADQPLVFAQPTSFSLGLLRRGSDLSSYFLGSDLTDAGGGAGVWQASVRQLASVRGAAVSVACDGERSRQADPRRRRRPLGARRRRAAASSCSPAAARRGGSRTGSASACRASAARATRCSAAPGLYRGNTRGRPARVSSYRYPSAPGPLGVTQRLAGPEQVFRFVVHGRIANAGAVVVSEAPGSHVTPRLVRAGNEDRLAGYPGLPLRLNPYQSNFFALIPAVGVFRPAPGAYDLVFDTTSRRAAGPLRLPLLGQRHQPARRPAADADGHSRQAAAALGARPRLGRRPLHAARDRRRQLPPRRLGQGARPRRRQDPDASAAAATSSSSPPPTTRRRRTTRTRAGRCRTRGA